MYIHIYLTRDGEIDRYRYLLNDIDERIDRVCTNPNLKMERPFLFKYSLIIKKGHLIFKEGIELMFPT